jgi:hypothetical protein
MQALVRAVRSGVRVLDAGDQDLCVGKGLGDGGNERDRAAHTDLDDGCPPRFGEG